MESQDKNPFEKIFSIVAIYVGIFYFAASQIYNPYEIYKLMLFFVLIENIFLYLYIKNNYEKFEKDNANLISGIYRNKYTEIFISIFTLVLICISIFLLITRDKDSSFLNLVDAQEIGMIVLIILSMLYACVIKLILNIKLLKMKVHD